MSDDEVLAEKAACPFCGGGTTLDASVYRGVTDIWVSCVECCASGPRKKTDAEAISAWNAAASEPRARRTRGSSLPGD